MNPDYAIPILTILLSGAFSMAGALLVYRVQSRRLPSQNRQEDSQTMLNLTKISEEQSKQLLAARAEIKAVQKQLDEVLNRLSGTHRLIASFSMTDLLSDGIARLEDGKIEVMKPDTTR